MRLIIGPTLLVLVLLSSSVVDSKVVQSGKPVGLAQFQKSVDSLSKYETTFLGNLIGQLILDQIHNALGSPAPARFKNTDLFRLNLSDEDQIASDALRNAVQSFFDVIVWPFNVSKDEYEELIMKPCQSVVAKLAETAKVYRSSQDGALLYGLKYYEVCNTIVAAKRLESRVVSPEKPAETEMRWPGFRLEDWRVKTGGRNVVTGGRSGGLLD